MKSLRNLIGLLAALLSVLPSPAQTIAVDTGTYAPAWTNGQRNVPFVFNKDTGALKVEGGAGGGGGGGSTTFSSPQSFRLSTGSAWQDFVFGAGPVTANTLRVTLGSDGPAVTALSALDSDIGAPADAAASSDAGTFAVIPLMKRGLQSQTTGNSSLATIAGRTPALGQATMANSSPVVMASDQGAIPVRFGRVLASPTNNIVATTGTTQYQITPGSSYNVAISIHSAVLGATANTLASCTTTLNSTTVNYTGTAPQVGQLLAGTGITPGSYVVTTNPGVNFVMSLPATASGTATLNVTAGSFAGTFEVSPDGTTWSPVTLTPKTFAIASTPSSTFVAPGLWKFFSGQTDRFFRFNLTTLNTTGVAGNLTSGPSLRFDVDEVNLLGGNVHLPYVSYVAATAATFPTGIPMVMPFDTEYLSEISVDLPTFTGTSQTITWRQSNDPTGVLFQGLGANTTQVAQNTTAITQTTAGNYRLAPNSQYFYAAVTNGSAVTAMSIGGVVGRVGAQPSVVNTLIGTNNVPVNLSQVGGTTTVNGGVAGMLAVGGNVAEDAAVTANPVIVGGITRTALPASSVIAGDAQRATFSTSGQLVTKPYAPRDLDFQVFTTITTNTQTAIRAAQAAGIRQNITSVTYQNTSATATSVTIQDGATTIFQISAPASMANPVQLTFPQPLFGSAATALNYTAGTTGANVLLLVTGFNSY